MDDLGGSGLDMGWIWSESGAYLGISGVYLGCFPNFQTAFKLDERCEKWFPRFLIFYLLILVFQALTCIPNDSS